MKYRYVMFWTALLVVGVGAVQAAETGRMERMQQMLDSRFAKADTNADGELTLTEAQGKMPYVAQHFKAIDQNNDGLVSRAEIEQYLMAQMAQRSR